MCTCAERSSIARRLSRNGKRGRRRTIKLSTTEDTEEFFVRKTGGETPMPTYVTLLNLTQKGVETIKQSPQRVEAAKQMAKSAGGEIKAVYY
ncbi:MAG: hypothetical protein DMG01_25560, partial [Acidobacteria bacterium]